MDIDDRNSFIYVLNLQEEVNAKRLQTLHQREEDRQKEKERIAAMLAQVESGKRKEGHVTFDDDHETADEDTIMKDGDVPEPISKEPQDAVKWMFDSDDDDDDTLGKNGEAKITFSGCC